MLRPALQATWQEQSKDLSLLRRDLDNLRAAKAKKMEAYQLVIYGLPPPGLKSNTPVYSYSLVFRLPHHSHHSRTTGEGFKFSRNPARKERRSAGEASKKEKKEVLVSLGAQSGCGEWPAWLGGDECLETSPSCVVDQEGGGHSFDSGVLFSVPKFY